MLTDLKTEKRTVSIDPDTDEGLDWLKQTLGAHKSWIVKRLVAEEIERLKGGETK